MSHEEARQKRYGHPATVIVFELDGLAKLVDRLGSDPGDRIETALGDAIMRLARRADHVARLDRGRYAALLPETDEIAAINYVERIRRACDLWLESGAIAMRLAIGWASTTGDTGLSGAVRVATDRMRVELRRHARGVGDGSPVPRPAAGIWATSRTTPSGSDGQSTPSRIARPGVAPVCSPSLTTSVPLTMTSSMPVGYWRGSS